MSAKFAFRLSSEDAQRPLPSKLIIGQKETETTVHVMQKALAYLHFFRDRIQIDTNLHMETIPFVPDLSQLDYTLRPALWVECGECGVAKLHKLAVKLPGTDIWIVKRSKEEADRLLHAMEQADLRRDRYRILAFDQELFEEMRQLLGSKNEIRWYRETREPTTLQLDFNGLWFELPFEEMQW